jgi:hypothetical protein
MDGGNRNVQSARKLKGSKPLGRSSYRCDDNTKIDFKELSSECVG